MRRNDLDICADLLRIASAGAKKTHLVYKANLNFNIVKKYLNRLQNNELIENYEGQYFTTDKGIMFLENYRSLVYPLTIK